MTSLAGALSRWAKKAAAAQYPTTLVIRDLGVEVSAACRATGRSQAMLVAFRDLDEGDAVFMAIDFINHSLREDQRKAGRNG